MLAWRTGSVLVSLIKVFCRAWHAVATMKSLVQKVLVFLLAALSGGGLLCRSPGLLQLPLVAAVFKKFQIAQSPKNVSQCLKLNIQSCYMLLVFSCLLY